MRKFVGLLLLTFVLSAQAEGWIGVGVAVPGFLTVEYAYDRARVGLSIDPFTTGEVALKADWALVKLHRSPPTPWGTRVQQELRIYAGLTGSYFYKPYVLGDRSFNYAFGGYLGYGTATQLGEHFRYGVDLGVGLRNPPDVLGYLLLMDSSPGWGLFLQGSVHLDFAL